MQSIFDPTTRAVLRRAMSQMYADHQWFQKAVIGLCQAEMEREEAPVRWRRLRAVSRAIVRAGRWLSRRLFRRKKHRDMLISMSALDRRPTHTFTDERRETHE